MLLKLPPGPIMVDNKELCSNLKLSLKPDTWQGKLIFDAPDGNHVSILVQACAKPKISNLTVTINPIVGIEETKGIPFKLQLEYKILKRIFKISGSIGNETMTIEDSDLISLISKVIQHTAKK